MSSVNPTLFVKAAKFNSTVEVAGNTTLDAGVKLAALNSVGVVVTDAFGNLATDGALPDGLFPALTGDVTTPGSSLATTVARIQGVLVSGVTGSNKAVLSDGATLSTPTVSDVLTAGAAGSASAPAIALVTSNTGVYQSAAHTVDITTNGSQSVSVSATGQLNVGVTRQPDVSHQFVNKSTSNNNEVIHIQNADATASSDGVALIAMSKGSSTNAAGTNHFVDFWLSSFSGSPLARIASNGANSVAFFNVSDRRLKSDITPLAGALATVARLNPVAFTWKQDKSAAVGFIAQELQAVMPAAVCKTDAGTGDTPSAEPWSMAAETRMTVYLVAAVKELLARVESLEKAAASPGTGPPSHI